ncbi:hypothetical protein C7387_1197 [Yokenella regensburgei]|jgi:hypothetical protein|uniref:Uncharacterized protein n=1 Tax=Yokenella regensburgei TaxID=158877 RepID=A0AB38FSQ7_9ENTR|nr:hypothetical protein FHR25_002279 [Yokenella regensburgei]RKR64499.1 hypothetical protein C7387_1197 [Yokenella regensburgei]SQA61024.1 Uncharacterised protein [Yokenella regensburgei]SQA66977.1 Uncharacterised protein [Yokenella regensburgei]SUQ05421.1 Uncharacterised protein [Yokenella regensburgei]
MERREQRVETVITLVLFISLVATAWDLSLMRWLP